MGAVKKLMLDDLKYIHQRDGQDALGIARKQWQQLQHQFEVSSGSVGASQISNIVYAGMGGSALSALLSRTWPGYKIPFEVCRQYDIPAYVSDKTLFIASSYSGNTEETLSALTQAAQRGARIFIIASGGKLAEIAQAKSYPLAAIPKVNEPRYAALYILKALVSILVSAGLVDKSETEPVFARAAEHLNKSVESWVETVPVASNPAKALAQELAGKSPAIYAGPLMAPAAYKWKISFNENSKNVAWWNELPEFDHNELTGWSSHPIEKPYGIVEIRSSFEHERVKKRFEVGEKLLSGRRPSPHVVQAQGSNVLEHLVWSVAFGDFVSIYLALLNNVNPTPVDLVEKFKTELNN